MAVLLASLAERVREQELRKVRAP